MSESEITHEQAQEQIDNTLAEAAENKTHPYIDGHHPGHKKAVESMRLLHEKAVGAAEPQTNVEGEELAEQPSPEWTKAAGEALEIVEGKHQATQEKLTKEAKVEMEKLKILGYSEVDIPDDISKQQIESLKMERLLAEGDYKSLTPMVSQSLCDLAVPPSVRAMFSTFCDAGELDGTLRREISGKIIDWIYQANKQKYMRIT